MTPLRVGQLVRVHQPGGFVLDDNGLTEIRHDCSDPAQHWCSRILRIREDGLPSIATSAERNPCHAEWPYYWKNLEAFDGPDWAEHASYRPGDRIRFELDEATPQYPIGAVLEGEIVQPHIRPLDWYVSFLVPDGTWAFRRVVKESCFRAVLSGTASH